MLPFRMNPTSRNGGHATLLRLGLYGNPFYAALFANSQQPILIQDSGQSGISAVVIPGATYDDDKETGLYLRIRGTEEDSVEFMMGRNANPVNLTSLGKLWLVPSYAPGAGAEAARAVRKVAELVVGGDSVADAVKKVNSSAISLTAPELN